MSFAALNAMGFLGCPMQRNPYGCGWTHPMSAYVMHCSKAHGGPGSLFHSGRPTAPHEDDCPCCPADGEAQS